MQAVQAGILALVFGFAFGFDFLSYDGVVSLHCFFPYIPESHLFLLLTLSVVSPLVLSSIPFL